MHLVESEMSRRHSSIRILTVPSTLSSHSFCCSRENVEMLRTMTFLSFLCLNFSSSATVLIKTRCKQNTQTQRTPHTHTHTCRDSCTSRGMHTEGSSEPTIQWKWSPALWPEPADAYLYSDNTWLHRYSHAEHCEWPENRWLRPAETHRNVLLSYSGSRCFLKYLK